MLFSYDPTIHDYSEEKPELVCIGHDHYVYGSAKEIETYKDVREKGVPLKSITILPEEERIAMEERKAAEGKKEDEEAMSRSNYILDAPLHDTGSFWLALLSFFLPILGLIGGWIYRKYHYIRNYKMCKKGAIAGLITLGVVVALIAVLVGLSVL